jgi:hypothetical protein
MKLAIHSDALYLSEPKARSRANGHMFMAGKEDIPINNGAVLNISQIIKAVMLSAAEAKLAALFINAKSNAPNAQRNGTPATENSHPNRQLHRPCTTYQQDSTQGIKSHGHVIPLAQVPRRTRSISFLLAAGDTKLGRLLD